MSPRDSQPPLHETTILRLAAELNAFQRELPAENPDSALRELAEQAVLDSTCDLNVRLSAEGSSSWDDGSEDPMPRQLGDFDLVRVVGRGGMGVVYEAVNRTLGMRVAVKVLPLANMLDPRRLTRFRNEARAASQLEHPHIVRVFSIGHDRGHHFFAMQLIEGASLKSVIASLRGGRRGRSEEEDAEKMSPDNSTAEWPSHGATSVSLIIPSQGNPRGPSDTVRLRDVASTRRTRGDRRYYLAAAKIAMHVAEALQHVHELGIVHRDIKPGNLLLDSRGHVWVVDFGLAQMNDRSSDLTMTGDVLGTLRYMSPEQALGSRTLVDSRSDVYSLGATLYEMLTLRPAHIGHTKRDLHHQIAFVDPPRPRSVAPDLPAPLDTIVMKALAKNPEDRYQTSHEMAMDLLRFQCNEPIHARPLRVSQRVWRWTQRHRRQAASAAVSLLLTAVTAVCFSFVVWAEKNNVVEEKSRVERLLDRSESLRLAAHSALAREQDPGLAMALAHESLQRDASREGREAFLSAFAVNHELATFTDRSPLSDVWRSRDGETVVTVPAHASQSLTLWDGGRQVRRQSIAQLTGAALDPAGAWLLAAKGESKQPALYNAVTAALQWERPGWKPPRPAANSFNAAGQQLVLIDDQRSAHILSTATGDIVRSLSQAPHEDELLAVEFAGRNSQWVVAVSAAAALVWESQSSRLLRRIELPAPRRLPQTARAPHARLTASGRQLLVWRDFSNQLQWWRVDTGESLGNCRGVQAEWINDRRLVVADNSGLQLRDAVTGRTIRTLNATGGVRALAVNDTGRWAATSTGKDIVAWNLDSGRDISLRGHREMVQQLKFTHDSLLLSAGLDNTARVWRLESGEETLQLKATPISIPGPQYFQSPEGRFVVPVSAPPLGGILHANSGFLNFPAFSGHTQRSRHPDRLLAESESELRVWKPSNDGPVSVWSLPKHGQQIEQAILDRTALWMAYNSGDNLYGANSEGECWQLNSDEQSIRGFDLHPALPIVAAAENENRIAFWALDRPDATPNADLPAESWPVPWQVENLRFSEDGSRLLLYGARHAEVRSYPAGEVISQVDAAAFKSAAFDSAMFVESGEHFVTWRRFATSPVSVWRTRDGSLQARHESPAAGVRVARGAKATELLLASKQGGFVWDYMSQELTAVTELPLQRMIATRDGKSLVATSHVPTTEMRGVRHDGNVQSIPYGESSKAWAAESVLTFDADSKALQRTSRIEGHVKRRLTPWGDSQVVLSVDSYGWALFDDQNATPHSTGGGHAGPVSFAALVNDGQNVVTTSWDGEIRLYEAGAARLLRRTSAPAREPIMDASWDPRRRRLATAGADGVVRLWRPETGEQLSELPGHRDQVWTVEFGPRGERLLSIDRSGVARLWRPDGLIREYAFEYPLLTAAFAPAGDRFLLVEDDIKRRGNPAAPRCVVRIYEAPDSDPVLIECPTRPADATFNARGDLVLINFYRGAAAATIYDARTGEGLRDLPLPSLEFAQWGPASDGDPQEQLVVTASRTAWHLWRSSDLSEPWLSLSPGTPIQLQSPLAGFKRVQPLSANRESLMAPTHRSQLQRWPLGRLSQTEASLPRPLTRDERVKYRITD